MTSRASGDVDTLTRTAQDTPGLELLLLFGSRAREDSHSRSDWDLGYLAVGDTDPATLRARLVESLGTDRVDLADLKRAGGVLRYRAARDGRLVFEARPGVGDRFRLEAARFWCDAAPVLQRGYEDVLADRDAVSVFDRAELADRTMAVERHVRRAAERLPASASEMQPAADASDAVVLHLWQATQIVIDLAMAACLSLKLGTPASHADAFRRLQQAKVIEPTLADRLVRAAGFRNVVAHAYDTLDMARVYDTAREGPADLLAFLAVLRDRAPLDG